ncbi:hypothetical protein AX774_g7452, partial [Zancudomyces culisetae]
MSPEQYFKELANGLDFESNEAPGYNTSSEWVTNERLPSSHIAKKSTGSLILNTGNKFSSFDLVKEFSEIIDVSISDMNYKNSIKYAKKPYMSSPLRAKSSPEFDGIGLGITNKGKDAAKKKKLQLEFELNNIHANSELFYPHNQSIKAQKFSSFQQSRSPQSPIIKADSDSFIHSKIRNSPFIKARSEPLSPFLDMDKMMGSYCYGSQWSSKESIGEQVETHCKNSSDISFRHKKKQQVYGDYTTTTKVGARNKDRSKTKDKTKKKEKKKRNIKEQYHSSLQSRKSSTETKNTSIKPDPLTRYNSARNEETSIRCKLGRKSRALNNTTFGKKTNALNSTCLEPIATDSRAKTKSKNNKKSKVREGKTRDIGVSLIEDTNKYSKKFYNNTTSSLPLSFTSAKSNSADGTLNDGAEVNFEHHLLKEGLDNTEHNQTVLNKKGLSSVPAIIPNTYFSDMLDGYETTNCTDNLSNINKSIDNSASEIRSIRMYEYGKTASRESIDGGVIARSLRSLDNNNRNNTPVIGFEGFTMDFDVKQGSKSELVVPNQSPRLIKNESLDTYQKWLTKSKSLSSNGSTQSNDSSKFSGSSSNGTSSSSGNGGNGSSNGSSDGDKASTDVEADGNNTTAFNHNAQYNITKLTALQNEFKGKNFSFLKLNGRNGTDFECSGTGSHREETKNHMASRHTRRFKAPSSTNSSEFDPFSSTEFRQKNRSINMVATNPQRSVQSMVITGSLLNSIDTDMYGTDSQYKLLRSIKNPQSSFSYKGKMRTSGLAGSIANGRIYNASPLSMQLKNDKNPLHTLTDESEHLPVLGGKRFEKYYDIVQTNPRLG